MVELFGNDCLLVPAVDQTSTCQSLGNRNPFLLATRNTTNASVSDEGFPRVAKTKDGDKNVCDFFDKVVPGLALHTGVRCTSLGCELYRFLDGQSGEMNVVLGGVLNVTAILSGDLLWGQRIVVDFALDIVVGITLVREHLEESRTSRSWTAQHN